MVAAAIMGLVPSGVGQGSLWGTMAAFKDSNWAGTGL